MTGRDVTVVSTFPPSCCRVRTAAAAVVVAVVTAGDKAAASATEAGVGSVVVFTEATGRKQK